MTVYYYLVYQKTCNNTNDLIVIRLLKKGPMKRNATPWTSKLLAEM